MHMRQFYLYSTTLAIPYRIATQTWRATDIGYSMSPLASTCRTSNLLSFSAAMAMTAIRPTYSPPAATAATSTLTLGWIWIGCKLQGQKTTLQYNGCGMLQMLRSSYCYAALSTHSVTGFNFQHCSDNASAGNKLFGNNAWSVFS